RGIDPVSEPLSSKVRGHGPLAKRGNPRIKKAERPSSDRLVVAAQRPRQPAPGADAQLAIGAGEGGLDALDGEEGPLGHLLVAQARRRQLGDAALGGGELAGLAAALARATHLL